MIHDRTVLALLRRSAAHTDTAVRSAACRGMGMVIRYDVVWDDHADFVVRLHIKGTLHIKH